MSRCGLPRLAITLVIAGCYAAPATDAFAQSDVTPPTLDVATLSSAAPGNNQWHKADVTISLRATDDTGVQRFEYALGNTAPFEEAAATPQGATPATGSVVVAQEGNTSVRYRAVDAAGNASAIRTIAVRKDTRLPLVTWPNVIDGKIGNSQTLTPTRTDQLPGSGGVAVREMLNDGQWAYPFPLALNESRLGRHTQTITVADGAGHAAKYTLTYVVTTSYADLEAIVGQHQAAGKLNAQTADGLRTKLSTARDASDPAAAISALRSFEAQARGEVTAGRAQNAMIESAQDLVRQVRGIPAEEVATGITSEATPGPFRPLKNPTLMPPNPNAKYKVLIYGGSSGTWRHEHMVDTEYAVQQMGLQHGFDVDIYDPIMTGRGTTPGRFPDPAVTIPNNPLEDLAALKQYDTILMNSMPCVGNLPSQAARDNIKAYIQSGGGLVALHCGIQAEPDNAWYVGLVGSYTVNHGNNQAGIQPDCGACTISEVVTEDRTNPSTRHLPKTWTVIDELHNYRSNPRSSTHTLLTLTESSYVGQLGVTAGARMGDDHPIAWCQNYDGGRAFSIGIGHNPMLWYPEYGQSITPIILKAIEWTAGRIEANCVTHREVKELVDTGAAAGTIAADSASALKAHVDAAYQKYVAKQYTAALSDIAALRSLAQESATGDTGLQLQQRIGELREWMLALNGAEVTEATVGGNVPATLSLAVGPPPSFGAFLPGVTKEYTADMTATVTSSAGDALLTVSDPSSAATGHLVNGTRALPQPLQARATSAGGGGGAFGAIGSTANPLGLVTYNGPVGSDPVAIQFRQAVAASDALRTGAYSKSLVYTLSTTTP